MVVMELEGGQQLAKFADGGGKGSKIVKVCQCLKWMGPNSFHFSSNLQTKVPNHSPEHFAFSAPLEPCMHGHEKLHDF